MAETLGAVVARLGEPGRAAATLIEAGELALLVRFEAAAGSLETTTGALASFIVETWLARATDDDWLRLVAVMGKSDRPGLAALTTMLEDALAELDRKTTAPAC